MVFEIGRVGVNEREVDEAGRVGDDFHQTHVHVAGAGIVVWDFPYGFMPTNSVGLFLDFPPATSVCKNFFPVCSGFSSA